MRKRALILALPATLWLALPCPAPAQWFNDPYRGMAPVCMAPGEQTSVKIGRLSSGYSAIFWIDFRTMGEPRAYYQVLNQQGVRQLDPDGLPLIEGAYYWYTSVSAVESDAEGGLIAIIRDERDGARDLYGQRFDSLGDALWEPTGAPVAIWLRNEDVVFRDSATDSLGYLFVAWAQDVMFANSIFVQKVNLDGERLWGDYGVLVCNGSWFTGFSQKVVPDGRGGVMVIWEDERTGPNDTYLYFQHFDSLGNALLPANGVPVLYPSGSQMGGNLYFAASDGRGGCLCFKRTPGNPTNVMVLFRLRGDGRTLWCWTSSPNDWDHEISDILFNPLNNRIFLTSWENRPPSWTYRYYLYCWDLSGLPLFGRRGLPDLGGLLVPTSDGAIAIETELNGVSTRVWAARVDTTGHKIWRSFIALGGITSGYSPIFLAAACVSDGADGAVVALLDHREQPTDPGDIVAQRVLANGQLGSPAPPVRAEALTSQKQTLSVSQNIIRFELPGSGRVSLVLYNLLGQQVAVLEEGEHIAGAYTVPLNLDKLPSGIYLLQLTTPAGAQTAKVALVR